MARADLRAAKQAAARDREPEAGVQQLADEAFLKLAYLYGTALRDKRLRRRAVNDIVRDVQEIERRKPLVTGIEVRLQSCGSRTIVVCRRARPVKIPCVLDIRCRSSK